MYDKNYLESLDRGEDRMNYLKKCIAEADNEKDIKQMLQLRHDYIQESVFHDDSFKALIMFPEFMKLFDENPGMLSPRSFMFPFKWILENSEEYYQIPLEQIERYFDRFKEYIEKFGYTKRTYYYKIGQVFQNIDRERALAAYEEMSKYERTEISDCEACEGNGLARREMRFGSPEKAVRMLNEMLDRNMKCTEVPQTTYATFAFEFARRGMYADAEHYAALFLPMIKGDEVNFLNQIADVIGFKTLTDPNGAYELFCRCAGMFSKLKNPSYRFDFANAAYRFFRSIAKDGGNTINMRLSSDFEFFSADGKYNPAELRDKFYAIAADLAEKFDKRNGNDNFAKMLAFEYPETPAKRLELPVHGSVTPDSVVFGLLFKSKEVLPDTDSFEPTFKALGLHELGYGADEENHTIYVRGKDSRGVLLTYALIADQAPDLTQYELVHWYPDGALDNLDEYSVMLVIRADTSGNDTFAEFNRMLKLANLLDKGDSPVIIDLANSRMLSKQWLKYEAEGSSFPFRQYFSRTWYYNSMFEDGKADIVTTGMNLFGSREFFVKAVGEDEAGFVNKVLNNILTAVSINPLTDEGVTMNSGIVYDERSYVRFTWKPLPLNVDGEDMPPEIFAEPIVYLTAADQQAGKGYKLTEIPEADREKLEFRTHNRFTENEEQKCKERFPRAAEYFRTHDDCRVIIGMYKMYSDEDGNEQEGYFHAELIEDGTKCKVLSAYDELANQLHEDDVIPVDPEKVFFVRIDLDGGEDVYFVDEFFILFG